MAASYGWPATSSSRPAPAATWPATRPSSPPAACAPPAWLAPVATTPKRWPPTPAAPGSPLTLRRDPGNEHDPNAIAVDAGAEQVGWVPREVAAELAPELDAGRPWAAIVLREQRRSPRDPRTGLTMLLAPGMRIDLHAH